jgi:hypothetical protein
MGLKPVMVQRIGRKRLHAAVSEGFTRTAPRRPRPSRQAQEFNRLNRKSFSPGAALGVT